MSWQSAPQTEGDYYGRPSVWHNRTSSAGQGSFVSASDLSRHHGSIEFGGSETQLPTTSSWQTIQQQSPPLLPSRSGLYDSVSRDSGLNVSPDGFKDQNKENEPMQIHSMQDLSGAKWGQSGLYNSYENSEKLPVDTNSKYSSETPPKAQSSPNINDDVKQNPMWNVPHRPPRNHPSMDAGTKPPAMDVPGFKYGREVYHSKSSSLPISMGSQPLFVSPHNWQDQPSDKTSHSADKLHMSGHSLDLQRSPGLQKSIGNEHRSFSYRGTSHTDLKGAINNPSHIASSSIDRIDSNKKSSSLPRGAAPHISDIIPPPPTSPASPLKVSADGYPSTYNYIVKNPKPCYNTSTQTDSVHSSPVAPHVTKSDVQCGTTDSLHRPPKFMVPTEEKSIQAQSPGGSTSSVFCETSEESPSSGLVESRDAGYRAGPVVNQLEQYRRIHVPETIREDSPSINESSESSGTAEIINRIHEHSPSQTSMLRKLSMELYGSQGIYNKNVPGQRSNQRHLDPHAQRLHSNSYLPNHVRNSGSRDSGFSSFDLQSTRDDDSVYTGSHAGSHSNMSSIGLDKVELENKEKDKHRPQEQQTIQSPANSTEQKHIPKEIPPTNFSRQHKNQQSLRKAYGIFDEIDIDGPKHGKTSSYIDLLTAKPKDTSAKDRRRSEEPKAKEKEVRGFQKLFGKKMKRTSSDNLRPMKEKARQEVIKEQEPSNSERRRSHSEYPVDKHEIRSRQGSDPTSQIKRESVTTEQRSLRSSEPVPKVRTMSSSHTAPNLHEANSSGDSDTVFNTKQFSSVHSSSISAIDDKPSPEELSRKQQSEMDYYGKSSGGQRSSLSNSDQYLPVFSPAVPLQEPGVQARKNSDIKRSSLESESSVKDSDMRRSSSSFNEINRNSDNVKRNSDSTRSSLEFTVSSPMEKSGQMDQFQVYMHIISIVLNASDFKFLAKKYFQVEANESYIFSQYYIWLSFKINSVCMLRNLSKCYILQLTCLMKSVLDL